MSIKEFDLIQTLCANTPHRPDVMIGPGDDGAIVQPPHGMQLVSVMDTLVENVHFFSGDSPADIAYKAIAVNLSDCAAMGATPAWVMLSLSGDHLSQEWISDFASGLLAILREYNLALIGGDTTRGPLSVTVHIQGFIPSNQAILRRGAKVGDQILVSGCLGDAGLALRYLRPGDVQLNEEDASYVINRLHRPTPRVSLGESLRGVATSMIDISDGLLADLGHILKQSQVGAKIFAESIPFSHAMQNVFLTFEEQLALALTSGDDYELCFTVPSTMNIESLLQRGCFKIGEITEVPGLQVLDDQGKRLEFLQTGYQHRL